MLESAQAFSDQIKALTPSDNAVQAITAFVKVVADFTNQVQAGPTGTPGILTFGNQAMITLLSPPNMPPVMDNSWIMPFAQAWMAGILTSVITPGTVMNPIWIGSGGIDIATLPTAAATIPDIAAAEDILILGLASVAPTSTAPLELATALRNATLALIFIAIGLGPPPTLTPIPLPLPAQ